MYCALIQTKKFVSLFNEKYLANKTKLELDNDPFSRNYSIHKDFAVALCRIPYEHITCAGQKTVKYLNSKTSEDLKQDMSLVLREPKRLQPIFLDKNGEH